MGSLLELKDTPVPAILVGAGIIFLILALGGQVVGQINIPPGRQRISGFLGVVLLVMGIGLYLLPALLPPPPSTLTATPPPTPLPPAETPPPSITLTNTPTAPSGLPPTEPPPSEPAAPGAILLHSSLDNAEAVTAPGIGQRGNLLNLSASDFVPGQKDNGIAFVREDQVVTFPASRGTTPNVDLSRGEVEFWYRPNYDATAPSGGRHILMRVAVDDSNPPALELSMYGGKFMLSAVDAKWTYFGTEAPYAAPLWQAEEWVSIRAVWDAADPADSLQLYVNDNRVDQGGVAGDWDLGTDPAKLTIFVGQANGHHLADGVIDEFIIRR